MNDSFFLGLGNIGNVKIIVIDGGFSKACQFTTGIAGYMLLYNSYGMQFVTYRHFDSKAEVLSTGTDVLTVKRLDDKELEWKEVKEMNVGEESLQEVAVLENLREHRYMK